ncbi:hypothetical protein L7F22_040385 [Adiantum nelumboides]|nr:hypothetical protein [Adiantum nelumboides]
MASGEGQSNPSTSGDAGGDHNEDYGNEYGPPLPTLEELREMEHRRLVGEATNMMLNFAKDPKLAKYMTETAFQDVHAQWKATTTSPPKPNSKKQYSEKELEQEVEARLAQIFDAHKKSKKNGKKRRKSTDFPGYLGRQSTFDKAKKHKKHTEGPSSSSSSSDSSSVSSKEDRKGKKRSKKQRHRKGKKKERKSKSRRVDDSSTEDTSTDSSDSEDEHFYVNKKNFYKANQYDFLEDKSKKVREFKGGGQSIKFETFSGYKDASKALSFIQQYDIAFAGGRYSEHSKIRRAASYFKGNARTCNRVEVEYLEAIALKRQEELIREEEAAGQAEIELKARREAAEKEKRNKKKQAKQRRNNRKEKERDGEEKQPGAGGQSRLGEGSTSSRAALSLSKEASIRTAEVVDEDDDSSVLDNTDGIVGTLQAAIEDGDADRIFWEREGSDLHHSMEASFSGGSCIDSAQNGHSNRKKQSLLDDSSSTCSSDSIPSNNATIGGFGRRRSNTADQLPNFMNRERGRIGSDRELRISDPKGFLRGRAGIGSSEVSVLGGVDVDTVIASLKQRVQWLQQRLQEKEEEVVLLHQQLSLYQHHYGCDILKLDDSNGAKVSDCCQSQAGSDSIPISPSRESGELLKNGGSSDDFQHGRGGTSDLLASLADGSCSEMLLDSGVQNIPVVSSLSKVSATSPNLGAMGSPRLTSLSCPTSDNISVHRGPDSFASTSQSIQASSLTNESDIVRPSSAPSPPEAPRQSPPFQQQSHQPPPLARSVSATGRLGVTSVESASSCPVFQVVPSYRNAAAGVNRSNQTGGSIAFSDANLRSQTSYSHASGSEPYRVSPVGDPATLVGSIYQRNLPASGQAVASKTKGEPLIQGFGKVPPGNEPEKFVGLENRSHQEPEHRRGGVGLTFGTVTPEVLRLRQLQQHHTESSEGSTLETNIMSRESERYREHQYNGRCSANEFVQPQIHASHSASLTQTGVAHRVAGRLAGGPQVGQRGAEVPGMSEDFPHLDIINELLDDDRLLGAKALNAFLQQPVALHELQRMYDGRICMDMNSLHGSAERMDNVLLPHDNGGVPQFASSAIGEGIQIHPYAHSSLQSSIGLPGGLLDAMPIHHWQGRSNDTSPVTCSNGLQVGLDMLMGYPMPSPHLPMTDCPPFTLGQNGYPMYSPIKHP